MKAIATLFFMTRTIKLLNQNPGVLNGNIRWKLGFNKTLAEERHSTQHFGSVVLSIFKNRDMWAEFPSPIPPHVSHKLFPSWFFIFKWTVFFKRLFFFNFPLLPPCFAKKKNVASGVLPFLRSTKMLEGQNKPFCQQNCFNIVSASYQCVSLGKSSVLLPFTTRPKWKKCCQGPKSGWPKPLGPHSGNLRGEW